MSLRCSACRSRLYDLSAGRASDADRLEVETHLAGCAACRAEQARWKVIGELGEHDPSLSTAARDRVRQRVMAAAAAARPEARASRSPFGMMAFAAASLAVVAAVSVSRLRHAPASAALVVAGEVRIGDRQVAPGTAIADGARLSSERGGEVRLDGPDLVLAPGTTIAWSRPERVVSLAAGQVTVEVTPGQHRGFRVATPRFTAEVVGTRFIVTMASVRTERGTVRVLGSDGAQLALVTAGQMWTMPELRAAADPKQATTPAAAPGAAPAIAPPAAATAIAPPASPTTIAPPVAAVPAVRPVVAPGSHSRPAARAEETSARGLLDQANKALAAGEAARARVLIREALAAHPPRDLIPEAKLMEVDALRIEGRRVEAVRGYRDVARRYGRSPQAESALFAVAQFELEAGRRDEARRGFADYLARYPHGQYRSEAQGKLANLGTATP